MVRTLWFLVLVGSSGLHVETDTPDALCPPLELVREAVRSRLGEVEGGPYEARYTVVRGGEQGSDALLLTVTDASGHEMLRRELPLDSMGCGDAVGVVALVLERFFQQMNPAEVPTPAEDEPTEAPAPLPTNEPASEPASEPAGERPAPEQSEPVLGEVVSDWSLRAGGGLHMNGIPGVGLGVSYDDLPWGSAVVDATWPLLGQEREEAELQLRTESSWLLGSSLLFWRRPPWSAGLGPLVALQLERAAIEGAPSLSAGLRSRVLIGVGAHGVVRFDLSRTFQLELGIRAAPMLTGATERFVVLDRQGRETEVLRPEGLLLAGFLGFNLGL